MRHAMYGYRSNKGKAKKAAFGLHPALEAHRGSFAIARGEAPFPTRVGAAMSRAEWEKKQRAAKRKSAAKPAPRRAAPKRAAAPKRRSGKLSSPCKSRHPCMLRLPNGTVLPVKTYRKYGKDEYVVTTFPEGSRVTHSKKYARGYKTYV